MCIWLVVFFLCIAAYELYGPKEMPWKHAWLEPYMLGDENDYWVHNFFLTEKIKTRDPDLYDHLFVFLGGSSAMYVIHRDSYVSEKVHDLTGDEIGFFTLSSPYQSFSNTSKVISALGPLNGTFLIAVSPYYFITLLEIQLTEVRGDKVRKNYYFQPTPVEIERILKAYGHKASSWNRFHTYSMSALWGDVLKNKFMRLLRKRRLDPITTINRHHLVAPAASLKYDLIKLDDQVLDTIKMNLELLNALTDLIQANGDRVILVYLPINPSLQHHISEVEAYYDNMMRDFLERKKNVPYIDVNGAMEWKAEDFIDGKHMREPTRAKFTEIFSQKLAHYIEKEKDQQAEE